MIHFCYYQQILDTRDASHAAQGKAKCFLKYLTSTDMMYFSAFMFDVLAVLKVCSTTFQRRDGTAADIHQSMKKTLFMLNKYKTK